MSVNLSPVFNDQIFTLAGVPAAGYKLFTYAAGSTTKTNTYTTSSGNVANANPIILDSNGFASNGSAQVQIWLTAGTSYKFVLALSTDTDPPGSPIRTEDNINGINDTVVNPVTEWIASTFSGITYVSATQFTVTGDQTAILTLNRRLKTTNTAGTIYSYISAVDYNISNAGKTTVTVVSDSGTLDSGLSAVSYGIINPTNSSLFPSTVTQAIKLSAQIKFINSGAAIQLGTNGAGVNSGGNTSAFTIAGGNGSNDTTDGGRIIFYGSAHATNPGQVQILSTATLVATSFNDGSWTLGTPTGSNKGAGTGNATAWYENGNRVYSSASMFESTELGIAVTTNYTAAHGFGVVPKLTKAYLRCKTAELGFNIGDEIEAVSGMRDATNNFPLCGGPYANATNVGFTFGSSFFVLRPDTGANGGITLANWKIVLRAWK